MDQITATDDWMKSLPGYQNEAEIIKKALGEITIRPRTFEEFMERAHKLYPATGVKETFESKFAQAMTNSLKGGTGSGNHGHAGRPGKRGGSQPSKATSGEGMKIITSFREILNFGQHGENFYIRWSRGPELDKQQKNSFDQVSKTYHVGLSAQNLRTDDPKLMARMIPEYRYLRRADEKRYPWIFNGTRTGTDSDGAPLIDSDSIVPIGKISDGLLEKMIRFSDAAIKVEKRMAWTWDFETKKMVPRSPEHAKIQQEYDDAWAELNKP